MRQPVAHWPRQRLVVDPPNRRLRPVLNPDLAKNRVDMDLHGRLGDIDLARDAVVGIAFDQAAQNRCLPRGTLLGDSILWCVNNRIAVAAR